MPNVRRSHMVVWGTAAVLTAFLLLGSAADIVPAVLLSAAGTHFLLNVLFSLRSRRRSFGAVRPVSLAAYQDSSPSVLEEIFGQEGLAEGLVLPVCVEGGLEARETEEAPWSGLECVGWSLHVETYRKTALGGDSDYAALLVRHVIASFEIESAGKRLRVMPPGLVAGSRQREALLAWKALDVLPALRAIVDNEMQLQKIPRRAFTGVRVLETILLPGDKVRVYGRASKGGEGIEMRGGDVPGPEALTILASAPGPAKPGAAGPLIRLAASAALFAAGWALAALYLPHASWWRLEQSYPWMNVERVGRLAWRGSGAGITVSLAALNLPGTSSWTMDPGDEDVNLVSDDTDAVVKRATQITLSRLRLSALEVLPGAPAYPRLDGARYHFEVPGSSPSAAEISAHAGSIHVINRTAEPVEIRFVTSTDREEITSQYWTVDPASGAALQEGTKLVLEKSSFTVTEGDGVLLRLPGASSARDAFVTLGGGAAAAWDGVSRGWLLTIDAALLEARSAPLLAANPEGYEARVTVLDRSRTALETWTLSPGFGGRSGKELQSGGRPFIFQEGYLISVEPLDRETLYQGEIGAYRGARWERGVWTIGP